MKKIWMIGTASSGSAAPYNDKSWEIWGVSARAAYTTRATRWFELHRLDGEPDDWANKWRETIKTFSHDVELVMLYPEKDLGKKVTQYPYDRIAERFGTYFMTSTFSWMMALAIDELRPLNGKPVKGEIGISGVDMEYGTEYRQQRAGLRHFIELAKALGIPVTRLADGGLAYDPVPYPLWQDDPLLNKLDKRKREADNQLKIVEESIRHTRTMIAQDRAAIEEIKSSKKKGYRSAERLAFLEKELGSLMETSAGLSRDIVRWEAKNEENDWLSDFLQP